MPERPNRVRRVGGERVDHRERAPPGRRVEREPPVAGEPRLDPCVRVLVRDRPDTGPPRPGREPDRDPGRNAEESQHHRHRARVVLAVPGACHLDEVDERRVAAGGRGGCSSYRKPPRARNQRSSTSVASYGEPARPVSRVASSQSARYAQIGRYRSSRKTRSTAASRPGSPKPGKRVFPSPRYRPVAAGYRGGERRQLARRRAGRVAPDGVLGAAPQRAARLHHAPLEEQEAAERRAVDPRGLRPGRDAGIVEALDLVALDEPVLGLDVPTAHERVCGQPPPRRPGVDRVEVLEPAVGGERLERRDTPVLGALGRTDREHRRGPRGEVDAFVVRVPHVAKVGGAAAARERLPAAPVDPPIPRGNPREGDAPEPATTSPATPRPTSATTGIAHAQDEPGPEDRAERQRAVADGVRVLQQHGREADPGPHCGGNDGRTACAGAERRDEREREAAEDDERMQRRLLYRIERRAHRRGVVQSVPGGPGGSMRPCLEEHRQRHETGQHGHTRLPSTPAAPPTARVPAPPRGRTGATRPGLRATPRRPSPRRRRAQPRRAHGTTPR